MSADWQKGITPIRTDSTDDGRRERGGRKGCAKEAADVRAAAQFLQGFDQYQV
jgi:hypothetical protein